LLTLGRCFLLDDRSGSVIGVISSMHGGPRHVNGGSMEFGIFNSLYLPRMLIDKDPGRAEARRLLDEGGVDESRRPR
jgi:hypothetical protein